MSPATRAVRSTVGIAGPSFLVPVASGKRGFDAPRHLCVGVRDRPVGQVSVAFDRTDRCMTEQLGYGHAKDDHHPQDASSPSER